MERNDKGKCDVCSKEKTTVLIGTMEAHGPGTVEICADCMIEALMEIGEPVIHCFHESWDYDAEDPREKGAVGKWVKCNGCGLERVFNAGTDSHG